MSLNNRIFFELAGPVWAANIEAHEKLRQDRIDAGHACVAKLVGKDCKLARRVRGALGVWVPGDDRLPRDAWLDCGGDADGEGRYYRPRMNSKRGKVFAAQFAKLEVPPEDEDFVKQHLPQFDHFAFSDDGQFAIRATMGRLAGKMILVLPDCEHNRKAAPTDDMIRLKASEVMKLYEDQLEEEKQERLKTASSL